MTSNSRSRERDQLLATWRVSVTSYQPHIGDTLRMSNSLYDKVVCR